MNTRFNTKSGEAKTTPSITILNRVYIKTTLCNIVQEIPKSLCWARIFQFSSCCCHCYYYQIIRAEVEKDFQHLSCLVSVRLKYAFVAIRFACEAEILFKSFETLSDWLEALLTDTYLRALLNV